MMGEIVYRFGSFSNSFTVLGIDGFDVIAFNTSSDDELMTVILQNDIQLSHIGQ